MNKEVNQPLAPAGDERLPAVVTQRGQAACIHFGGHGHNGHAWMSADWAVGPDESLIQAFGPYPAFGLKMRPWMMHPMPFI